MPGPRWIIMVGVVGLAACAHDHSAGQPAGQPASQPVSQSAAAAGPASRPRAVPSVEAPPLAPPADPAPSGEVAAALAQSQEWLARLPACAEGAVAAAKDELPGAGGPARLRGRLTHGAPLCTMMACLPPRECCNTCGWDWLVTPRGGPAARHAAVRLQQPGAKEPLRGGGADCVLDRLPAPEVVVTGRVGAAGDVIVDASVCVARAAP